MKRYFPIILILSGFAFTINAQNYFDDDIYYNAKKDTQQIPKKSSKTSNYIANMADMDVDTYNRRNETYYTSSIDTIGTYVENGEDFVYTQQIQKYYNPTIVVDNADILGDVLSNTYGNVEIVINNNGLPVFTPFYSWNYPYLYGAYSPYYWGFNIGGWGWNVGFYDPWFSWNWGPSWGWTWGPGWGWNWGPGWGPGPGPAPWRPGPPMAWRPGGNRPVGPNPGWGFATRPGGNFNGAPGRAPHPGRVTVPSPGTHRVPGMANNNMVGRPAGVVNNNGRWEYNNSGAGVTHRQPATGVTNINQNRTPATSTVNRNPANNVTKQPSTTRQPNNTSVTRSPSNNNNRVSTPSRNTSSPSRSTGGGGRSGGGGGSRGRHR